MLGGLRGGGVLLGVGAGDGRRAIGSAGQERRGPGGGGAPPVGHIDDPARDALREILREESGE